MIYIHTHPTQNTLNRFNKSYKFISQASDDDKEAMEQISNNNGVAYGVVLDQDSRILIGTDGEEITRKDRCGY